MCGVKIWVFPSGFFVGIVVLAWIDRQRSTHPDSDVFDCRQICVECCFASGKWCHRTGHTHTQTESLIVTCFFYCWFSSRNATRTFEHFITVYSILSDHLFREVPGRMLCISDALCVGMKQQTYPISALQFRNTMHDHCLSEINGHASLSGFKIWKHHAWKSPRFRFVALNDPNLRDSLYSATPIRPA